MQWVVTAHDAVRQHSDERVGWLGPLRGARHGPGVQDAGCGLVNMTACAPMGGRGAEVLWVRCEVRAAAPRRTCSTSGSCSSAAEMDTAAVAPPRPPVGRTLQLVYGMSAVRGCVWRGHNEND